MGNNEMGAALLLILFVVASLLLYLFPTLIAFGRGHHNRWAIFALNLLLGWIVIGWIIALIWSLTTPASTVVLTHHMDPADG